jgi:hypothetical protein
MGRGIYRRIAGHSEWISHLSAYMDELEVIRSEIDSVKIKNSSEEVHDEICRMQEYLSVAERQMEILRQEIRREEQWLVTKYTGLTGDHRQLVETREERELKERFDECIANLRKEFRLFLANRL